MSSMPASRPPVVIDKFPDQPSPTHQRDLARPARLASLVATGLPDSLPEEAFDRVVRLATQVTGVPVGLFSLVDDQRQFFKAKAGLEGANASVCETPLSSSFCQYVVTTDRPLAVADARDHPMLHDNGAINGLDVVAYLGTPIHAPSGDVIGSLCAIDNKPRDWTETQAAALRDLAAIIETELVLRQAMAARALIMAEMDHRVKNLFAMVGGMVRLSRRAHETADALAADLEARVGALARAHQLIVPDAGLDAGAKAQVPLIDLMTALLQPYDGADVAIDRIRLAGPVVPLGPKAATSLALACHEMATNSLKYGALGLPDGVLRLDWLVQDGKLLLDWAELTEKPVDLPADGSGFGSQLLEMTVEGQLQGQITTVTCDRGLRRQIRIPAEMLVK